MHPKATTSDHTGGEDKDSATADGSRQRLMIITGDSAERKIKPAVKEHDTIVGFVAAAQKLVEYLMYN